MGLDKRRKTRREGRRRQHIPVAMGFSQKTCLPAAAQACSRWTSKTSNQTPPATPTLFSHPPSLRRLPLHAPFSPTTTTSVTLPITLIWSA